MKTKEVKIVEGKARQKYWNDLTDEEKIKVLKSRPGNSSRQMKKLRKEALVEMMKADEKDGLYNE